MKITSVISVILAGVALFFSLSSLATTALDAQPNIEVRVIWTYSPGLNDDGDATHPRVDINKVIVIPSSALTQALTENPMVNINGVMTTKDADLRFA